MLNAILSIVSWVIGFFKPSPERELGRADVREMQLIKANKDLRNEMEIKSRRAGSDDDLINRL